jgi:hypothetical protein
LKAPLGTRRHISAASPSRRIAEPMRVQCIVWSLRRGWPPVAVVRVDSARWCVASNAGAQPANAGSMTVRKILVCPAAPIPCWAPRGASPTNAPGRPGDPLLRTNTHPTAAAVACLIWPYLSVPKSSDSQSIGNPARRQSGLVPATIRIDDAGGGRRSGVARP